MVEFIVKLGVFLFGNRWNSILASFVNLYLSNKFVRSYKVSKQLVTSKNVDLHGRWKNETWWYF